MDRSVHLFGSSYRKNNVLAALLAETIPSIGLLDGNRQDVRPEAGARSPIMTAPLRSGLHSNVSPKAADEQSGHVCKKWSIFRNFQSLRDICRQVPPNDQQDLRLPTIEAILR